MDKATKYGGECLTVKSDKAGVFIVKILISNIEDSKA